MNEQCTMYQCMWKKTFKVFFELMFLIKNGGIEKNWNLFVAGPPEKKNKALSFIPQTLHNFNNCSVPAYQFFKNLTSKILGSIFGQLYWSNSFVTKLFIFSFFFEAHRKRRRCRSPFLIKLWAYNLALQITFF